MKKLIILILGSFLFFNCGGSLYENSEPYIKNKTILLFDKTPLYIYEIETNMPFYKNIKWVSEEDYLDVGDKIKIVKIGE